MAYDVFFNCRIMDNKPVRRKGGWFDIPLPYDLYFEADEIVKITFDLRVKMPVGYEAIIQPRSSTLEKTGLISSGFGVIEDSYCGENDYIGYRFYATRDGIVSAGSYLVQMRFQKKMENCVDSIVPDEFFNGIESRGGFGSTDKEINSITVDAPEKIETRDYDLGFIDGYNQAIDDIKEQVKKLWHV